MDRSEIARLLEECGVLLELQGESAFRVNAYHNAARAILQLEGDLQQLIDNGELVAIKAIGKSMAEKIVEIARTGRLEHLEQMRQKVPPGMVEMLRINGFGPKRIQQVHKELGIDSIAALKLAAQTGQLVELKGFGTKLVEKILAGIEFLDKTGKRVLYPVAWQLANRLREVLEGHPAVQRLAICGSLRRGRSTIKDIDVLVASDNPEPIMKRFVEHPDVMQITNHGSTKSSVILHNGVPADLRVVSDKQFPFALHYFTGSKEHNVSLRARAQAQELKLNEYELAGPKRTVDCREEADIFAVLGLDYIPPELREDTGEVVAAENHALPSLVQLSDITGTFHCHTNASDGAGTLAEMAAAAQAAGLGYLGIADHSQSARYANGLEPHRVRQQQAAIDALNASDPKFRVFKGIESDIRADGSLDYDEDILATFEYVVASVHDHLTMDEPTMTERVLKAVRHPRCTMLGHPTGRLLLRREAFPLDVERVLRECAAHGVMVEINANPHRIDLDWQFCKRAKALGVLLVINPDAHATDGLDDIRFGVLNARRGWLEADNIFNTRPLDQVDRYLRARRESKA